MIMTIVDKLYYNYGRYYVHNDVLCITVYIGLTDKGGLRV